MLLGRFEVAGLFVQFLCDGQVGLLEEAGSELGDQPDHVVVLLAFFVHGNGHIVLLDNDVHLLGLLPFLILFELLGLLHVKVVDLGVGEVLLRQPQGVLPLGCLGVHLECVHC